MHSVRIFSISIRLCECFAISECEMGSELTELDIIHVFSIDHTQDADHLQYYRIL